jgi:S-adenosylmethionine hydrolase
VFAPVAAALSKGTATQEFGPVIDDLIKLESLTPSDNRDGTLEATIIHIDRFGNCITNLATEHLADNINLRVRLVVNDHEITSFRKFFAAEADDNSSLFLIPGSAGFIEIAAQNSSAASILKVQRGQLVMFHSDPDRK